MFRVRPAAVTDYPAFAALFPELRVDDPTPPARQWETEMTRGTLVAEEDAAVVGYVYAQTMERTGYVRHVVVGPDVRGQGVGRALLLATAARLRARGVTRWCLNVRTDNRPARRLYEGVGMRPAYAAVSLRLDWETAAGLPVSTEVYGGPVTVLEDAEVEATMGLVPGQLATARIRASRVVRQLRGRDGRVHGVAIFAPALPGAFPFRVRDPALAGALLAALRASALPGQDLVNVVIEDDEALAAALLAAGATERMRFVHYDGMVPRTPGPAL